jgi:ribosomal protein L22
MKYAIPKSKEMTFASGTFSISTQNAVIVCKAINRRKLKDAKKFLEDIISEKTSLGGKHYTKTSEEILTLVNQVEKNAKAKNLEADSLFLFMSAHRGPTMHRGRRRWRKFGSRLKVTHVQAVLSDKNKFARVLPSEKAVKTPKTEAKPAPKTEAPKAETKPTAKPAEKRVGPEPAKK